MARKTGAQEIYERLRSQILDLSLEPGSYLDEAKIATTFGFSRSPVREALIRLTSERLAENLANRGVIVAPIEFNQIPAFQYALEVLYGSTCRLAAQNRQESQILMLEDIEMQCAEARKTGGINERVSANKAFHMKIAEIGNNNYLTWSLTALLDQGERILRMSSYFRKDSVESTPSTHHKIIESIRLKDADQAEEAGRADALFFRETVLSN